MDGCGCMRTNIVSIVAMYALNYSRILKKIIRLYSEVATTFYCIGKSLDKKSPICIAIVVLGRGEPLMSVGFHILHQPTTKLN